MPRVAASLGPWMVTGSPSKSTSPESYGWMPAMHLISVDLPAPLSPTSAMTSPSRTSKSTSVSACTEPKLLLIPRTASAGGEVVVCVIPRKRCVGGASRHPPPLLLLAELRERPVADVALLQET